MTPSDPAVREAEERLERKLRQASPKHLFAPDARDVTAILTALRAERAEKERLQQELDEAVAEHFTIDPKTGQAIGWDEVAASWRSVVNAAEAERDAERARASALERRVRAILPGVEREIDADKHLIREGDKATDYARGRLDGLRVARGHIKAALAVTSPADKGEAQ